ncbi:MAG: RagB/SusD family nutrient uptake outer membrane protein [Prolixibacteraceae bacterium]|jgi:tetratricopeptide (TPR) repeat protein|nr:RagB/SusD family nutrient uptake outer membrane protein [Prolixibacteraceae bacterium]
MKYITKHKIFQIIAVFSVIIACASCEDLFEQEAGSKVTPDLHYKTVTDLAISMDGIIAPLQQGMANWIIADGLLSDLMDVTENNDIHITALNEHSYSFDNPYLNTSDFYKVIINANEVLANIGRIPEVDPKFDDYYMKQYKNSIVGMRSWAYFTLAKIHGKVAYIEDNLTEIPANGLPYLSKSEILDTLINQLTPYLHLDDDLVETFFYGFINTKELLGEIYLEKNDYANAVTYLKLGVESYGNLKSLYKLNNEYDKYDWSGIFINAEDNITENICVIPFDSDEGQYNPLTKLTLPSDLYLVKPSSTIMKLYAEQFPLKGDQGDLNRGIGASVDTTANNKPYINKYALEDTKPYSSDIIISRAADIHLLLAEALNRMGDHETALVLLNDGFKALKSPPSEYRIWSTNLGVRGRAYLQNRTVPDDVSDITEYIEDLIIEERAMELAFEGKRYFDLMRIAERRGDPEYLAGRVYKKFNDKNKGQAVKEFLRNEMNWFVPLNK